MSFRQMDKKSSFLKPIKNYNLIRLGIKAYGGYIKYFPIKDLDYPNNLYKKDLIFSFSY